VPLPAGAIAVNVVGLTTVNVAAAVPNRTAVAPLRAVPVIVTLVPPALVPLAGQRRATAGTGTTTGILVNVADGVAELVPPAVTTVTTTPATGAAEAGRLRVADVCTGAAVRAAVVALIDVSLLTVNVAAATVPKYTAVAPVNPCPVIFTIVPPANEPWSGESPVTAGCAAQVKVASAFAALVPPGATMLMAALPLPAGDLAVIVVAPPTVNEAAGVVPNSTAVAPVNAVPVMVTLVPPAIGPALGETAAIDGTAPTVPESLCVAVIAFASVARTVKAYVPALVGVPVMAPVAVLRAKPVGKVPAVMANAIGAVPPVVATVAL
jgi:hypothetical protein